MADLLSGLVVAVSSAPVGTQTAAAAPSGATVLLLDDAIDMASTGGQVTLDGVVATYVEADDDESTITLTDPLINPLAEGAQVLVYPPRVDVTALVLVDGSSEPIPATVPWNMQDALSVGIRTEEEREQVRLTRDGEWSWAVFDLPGQSLDARTSATRISEDDGSYAGGVNDEGDVAAKDFSYTGVFPAKATTMLIDGQPLSEWRLDQPRGIVAYGSRMPSVVGIGNGEYGIMEFALPAIPDASTRLYRITIRAAGTPQGTLADPIIRLRLRAETAAGGSTPAAPSITSAIFGGLQLGQPLAGRANAQDFSLSQVLPIADDTEHRFLLSALVVAGATTFDTNGTWVAVIEDTGPNPGNSAVKNTGGGTLATGGSDTGTAGTVVAKKYTKTFDATDTKWWSGGGALLGQGDNQYFGNTSATGEGNRKSAIWFNEGAIRNTLAGAVVEKVELYLYLHNGGKGNTVSIGSHTEDVPTNTYTAISGRNTDRIRSGNWNEGTGRWVSLTFDMQGWKTNLAGIIVGPGPTDADTYAAGYRGATHGSGPRLRFTYSK